MKSYRDLSMSSLNQFGAVGIGANRFRRHFRKGRRSPFGTLRTVGIIAITGVLAYISGFQQAEAATVCESTLASYLDNPQQCETEVQGTVEEVTRSYQNRGYIRFRDTELWRSIVVPEYGDLLADAPCEFLVDHEPDDDADFFSDVTFVSICPSATVMISPTELRIVEGESASYAVSLGSEPEGTVTVSIGVIPPVQIAVFPPPPAFDVAVSTASQPFDPPFFSTAATLSFSASNWSVPQTVKVHVVEDDHVSGDLEYTIAHSVSGYGNVTTADDVVVLAVDNDSSGVTVTPTALTVDEGETGTYTVVLDADPDPGLDGLTVTVTPRSDNADVTFAPSNRTFTSANWDVSQTVTVTAAHDSDGDDESATLTHAVTGYGDVTDGDVVEVTVVDDDRRAVTVRPTALTLDEGSSGSYTVKLESEPPGTVTITPRSNNGDVTFVPASLTFTANDWSTEQRVTVRAAQDDDVMDESATLSHEVSGYGAVTTADAVTVNVDDDDDTAGVTITPTALAVDEGSTESYTVVLESSPVGTVTITPGSSNPKVSVSPASLSFGAGNWDSPRTVTVSAAEDDDAIDDTATLTHAVTGYGDVTDGRRR